MVLSWTAAGMLNAERSFRRIKAYTQMPQLVTALHRHAQPKTTEDTYPVGAAASGSRGIVTENPDGDTLG
jgi:putative transposase